MIRSKTALFTAFLAAGLFAAGLSQAGEGKNGGGGHSKNGGGGHSKNGGGGHSKNGGGGGGRTVVVNVGGGGGGGGVVIKRRVVCVVNNRVYQVRRVEDCLQQQAAVKRNKKRVKSVCYAHAHDAYCGHSNAGYNAGRGIEIGYGGQASGGYAAGGGFVGSPAAVAQAQRRASKNGGGYYVEGEQVIRVAKRKKGRKMVHLYHSVAPIYDSGITIHYGPVVSKGGSY